MNEKKEYKNYVTQLINVFKIEDRISFRKDLAKLIATRENDDLMEFNKKKFKLIFYYSKLDDEEIERKILKEN